MGGACGKSSVAGDIKELKSRSRRHVASSDLCPRTNTSPSNDVMPFHDHQQERFIQWKISATDRSLVYPSKSSPERSANSIISFLEQSHAAASPDCWASPVERWSACTATTAKEATTRASCKTSIDSPSFQNADFADEEAASSGSRQPHCRETSWEDANAALELRDSDSLYTDSVTDSDEKLRGIVPDCRPSVIIPLNHSSHLNVGLYAN